MSSRNLNLIILSFPTRRSSDLQGRIKDPRDFAGLVVTTRGGIPIRLGQVARIEDSQEEERDAAYVDGVRAVGLEVRKVSRSEEHTSELQSQFHIVCRLLLEKKK